MMKIIPALGSMDKLLKISFRLTGGNNEANNHRKLKNTEVFKHIHKHMGNYVVSFYYLQRTNEQDDTKP